MCNFWELHNHIALNKKKLKNEAKIEIKLLWLKHTPFEISQHFTLSKWS